MTKPLLEVYNLVKHFQISKEAAVFAVDDVSFTINQGETLGLVGESGCGKTTIGRAILRLIPPNSGQVVLGGTDVLALSPEELIQMRKRMQIIFQDPFSSLDPRKNIMKLISEPMLIHQLGGKKEIAEKTYKLMDLVGLTADLSGRFPHELDGGRCQRIGIARALALKPEFIVCDEPVSALDVSIQAQILNLLQDLQQEMNLTYLFISHNLAVVKHISSRIIVMYLGKIMEIAEKDELFDNPLHPYTQALLSAIPVPTLDDKRERIFLSGDVPTPVNPPPGCRFVKRCRFAQAECFAETPELTDRGNGHFVACSQLSKGFGGCAQ